MVNTGQLSKYLKESIRKSRKLCNAIYVKSCLEEVHIWQNISSRFMKETKECIKRQCAGIVVVFLQGNVHSISILQQHMGEMSLICNKDNSDIMILHYYSFSSFVLAKQIIVKYIMFIYNKIFS